MDRKASFMVQEFRNFGMNIVGIIVSARLKLSDQVVAATTRRRSQPLYASVVCMHPLTGQARKIRTSYQLGL